MNEFETIGLGHAPAARLQATVRAVIHCLGWGTFSTIAAVLVVALLSPAVAWRGVAATAHDLLFLAPYLILAFVLAGYLKAASLDHLLTQVFRGRPATMIVGAAVLGTMTPFCSCTVVALIAVLLQAGTPLSAVMAFWMASPVIGPDLFLYTAGIIGTDVALARLVAALFMALTGGFLTLLIERQGGFKSPMRPSLVARRMELGQVVSPHWRIWREDHRMQTFRHETLATAQKILPWMVLALFLESLMTAYIPRDIVAGWVGRSNAWAIPTAILVSIPTYANPVAGVPIAQALIDLGMSRSAALAYLVAGSVTTIPAMLAVLPLVRMRIFIWHIALGLITGTIAAYAFKLFLGE